LSSTAPVSLWTNPWAGLVDADPAVIQRRIADKETKVATYRRHCEEVWLLIHATGGGQAFYTVISHFARDATFESTFDRVFLLDAEDDLLELRLVRPGTDPPPSSRGPG
jgi:hypothetical protein